MTWPFENNTNAITRKLAKRSLQADKRRNIFLIVTSTLTTALLSGIFFTVFAEQRKMLSDLRGQYQTVVMETTQKEIEHLSTQPEIEQWGLSKDFGSARYQDSTLVVGYADKGWMKLGKKPSYVGNFPEKEQEIIVEQAFLDCERYNCFGRDVLYRTYCENFFSCAYPTCGKSIANRGSPS